jgi:hypothetical protein
VIVLVQLLHILVLWLLKFVPTPEFFVYPYLASNGWIPYLEIVDHHFPGLSFWPINFWNLGFTNIVSFKILLILVVLWQSTWIYKINKNIWAVVAYSIWQPFFEGTMLWYDLFIPVFTLPGFWAIISQHYFLAGVSLGLAVLIKQNVLLLAFFVAGYLVFTLKSKSFRPILKFVTGLSLPLIGLMLYVVHTQILEPFWYWNVVFNLSTYASLAAKAPTQAEFIKLVMPVVLVVVSLRFVKEKHIYGWFLFSLLGGLTRFGLGHFQPGLPFFAIIVGESWKKIAKWRWILVIISILWVGKNLWHPETFGQTQFFDTKTLELVSYIKNRTQEGDNIYLLGPQPHIYALTETLPSGGIFSFPMPWLLQKTETQLLSNLKDNPPSLVVYDLESRVDGQYLSTTASSLVEYVKGTEFQLIDQLGSYQIYAYRN